MGRPPALPQGMPTALVPSPRLALPFFDQLHESELSVRELACLQVREDNAPANRLYEGDGWKHLEMRVAELPAWQERWKGGVRPLRLMRKPLRVGAGLSRSGVTPAKSFDEFRVTIDTVLAYDDPEALVWFGLLMVRNAKFLSPQYRVLPGLLALIVWGAYFGTIRLLSHPEIVPDALRALGISAAAVAAAP